MQKTLQDLQISHERNEFENIMILVEERGDAFRGIPKLRRLSLLEYLVGVPWESPSLSSCHSLSLGPWEHHPKLEIFTTQNLMQKTLQDCTYRMNKTNPKTYRYLLKKEGMPPQHPQAYTHESPWILTWGASGIPKLELLPLFLLLTLRPSRSSNTSSTQNFNRKLGKIR